MMEGLEQSVISGLCLLVKEYGKKPLFEFHILKMISEYSQFNPLYSSIIRATCENQLQAVLYYLEPANEEYIDEDDSDLPDTIPVLRRQDAYIGGDIDKALEIAVEKGYDEIKEELVRRGACETTFEDQVDLWKDMLTYDF